MSNETFTMPQYHRTLVIEDTFDAYDGLMHRCAGLEPILAAVAHPCDKVSLTGPVEAAEAGLIVPILVGPAKKIRAAADEFGLDIGTYRLVDVPHSHAAAARAVELCAPARPSC